jgi:hypothetical protein
LARSSDGPGVFGALLGTLPSCAREQLAHRKAARQTRKLCIASDNIRELASVVKQEWENQQGAAKD